RTLHWSLEAFQRTCEITAPVGQANRQKPIGTNAEKINPPNWIFGPVWSTLYLMMAIAAWLTWRKSGRRFAHHHR
ncbi:TspO/MBR family protein, partial [Bremerella sp. JC817]|uniref:TspO/MBR family protein n=1 Tax=Bremerella sp. JC817 TaxID=3231756 RepID=UPI0034578892